mmetsp:Transcript_11031/g.16245  ORF Transcript_11031/g.16245 Transcript_11031/m.16245 type:complete len:324 (-) Transcript_11031:4-975(-)
MSDIELKGFPEEEKIQEAQQLFENKEYDAAAEILGKILEERQEKYGEVAYELGDLSYRYGKCMLEVAKEQNRCLFASQMQKAISERNQKEGEQQEGGEQEVIDPFLGKGGVIVPPEELQDLKNDVEDTLETGWQTLELARLIYETQLKEKCSSAADAKHLKQQLSLIHVTLAELTSERDMFDQAENEYLTALEYLPLEEYLQRASISVALAVVYLYNDKMSESISQYQNASHYMHHIIQENKENHEINYQDIKDRITQLKKKQREIEEQKEREQQENDDEEDEEEAKMNDSFDFQATSTIAVRRQREDNDEDENPKDPKRKKL